MFGIGGFKLLIILIAALILIGPDKLPEIGRTIGKALAMFKAAQADMERVIKQGMDSDGSLTSVLSDPLGTSSTASDGSAPSASAIYAATDDDEEEEEE